MKELECPACGEMIPDDSKYCDMCGAELLECINCGALGTDNFCPGCGKPMVARKTTNKPAENPQTPTKPKGTKEPGGETTIGGRRKTLVLKARSGGFVLKPEDGAVIGRQTSTPYSTLLADCDLISRQHGKFMKRGREWYIIDLGSTNGTLVNDVELDPDTPAKIATGDVVDLGTYIFDVVEQ